MMKWLLRLLAFAACFAFGVTVSFLRQRNAPVSLCEISAHPEKYAGKVIRTRALISRDIVLQAPIKLEPRISAFTACVGNDDWPAAIVDLDEQQSSAIRPKAQVWRDHKQVWRDEPDFPVFYLSDVIVVGRFDPHDDGVTRCFTPRFELAEATLERVISTTTIRREQTAEWVRSKSQ